MKIHLVSSLQDGDYCEGLIAEPEKAVLYT